MSIFPSRAVIQISPCQSEPLPFTLTQNSPPPSLRNPNHQLVVIILVFFISLISPSILSQSDKNQYVVCDFSNTAIALLLQGTLAVLNFFHDLQNILLQSKEVILLKRKFRISFWKQFRAEINVHTQVPNTLTQQR